jgi:GNAT superfamily N-acetyltransferase
VEERAVTGEVTVRHFEWKDWVPLNQLFIAQLAEHGITLDPDDIPQEPEDTDPDSPEWDLDHIDQVYLRGAGGFWLAWCGDTPAGRVGAQDLGGVVELRRMHVVSAYRRRGIGTCLVQAMIDHCAAGGVRAIELWTAKEGPGRFLYGKLGFRPVDEKGPGFEDAMDRPDEMRMRLDLVQSTLGSAAKPSQQGV